MWWRRRKKSTPGVRSWLSRADSLRVTAHLVANPGTIATSVSIKDNGARSWMECTYPKGVFFSFSLQRQFEVLPRDWVEVTELGLRLSGLGGGQCARVRAAVATEVVQGGSYVLLISPQGYRLTICFPDFQSRIVSEGAF